MSAPTADNNSFLRDTINNVAEDVKNKKNQKECDPDLNLLRKRGEVRSFLRESKLEGMDYVITFLTHKLTIIIGGCLYLLIWYVARLYTYSCDTPEHTWICTVYQDMGKLIPYIISNAITFLMTKIFAKPKI